jgi:hypothetical protein
VIEKLRGDHPDPFHTHQHDLGARRTGELLEIQRAFGFRGILVAREDRQLRRVFPVRHRDARISRRGKRGRDAGDDLEPQPRRRERFRFFTAATKQKRVASLQTHNALSFARLLHEQGIDLFLGKRMLAGFFPRIDDLRPRRSPCQDLGIAEIIIHDHLGALDHLFHFEGHQPDVTRPRPREITDSLRFGGSGDGFHKNGAVR